MILTPVRWIVMGGIAVCGFFMITSGSYITRGIAFAVSAVLWQFHEIIAIYDGYLMMRMAQAKKVGK